MVTGVARPPRLHDMLVCNVLDFYADPRCIYNSLHYFRSMGFNSHSSQKRIFMASPIRNFWVDFIRNIELVT
jgi:hypothetical protein